MHVIIALISPGELFGGAERQILTLADGLRKLGMDVSLYTLQEGVLSSEARRLGFSCVALDYDGRLSLLKQGRALRKALRDVRVQVAHFHGYRPTVIGGIACIGTQIICVKTEHGRLETDGASLLVRLKLGVYRYLEVLTARILRFRVAFVTQDLKSFLYQDYKSVRTAVIHNGASRLNAAELPVPAEFSAAHNFVCAGRLTEVKAFDRAIRAFQKSGLSDSAVLHILGDGPLAADWKALALELGIGSLVRFHGHRPDSINFIAHASALLVPSLHEGLPYVVLEAMHLRTLVIASSVGGIKEIFADTGGAMLTEPGDENGLSLAIKLSVEDPEGVQRRVAISSRMAEASFTEASMARQYLDFYRLP